MRFILTICIWCLISAGLISRANAGTWLVSYQCTGQYQSDGTSVAWPSDGGADRTTSGAILLDNYYHSPKAGSTWSSSGTISATYIYSSLGPGDVPSVKSLHVLESAMAMAGGEFYFPTSTNVSDGFAGDHTAPSSDKIKADLNAEWGQSMWGAHVTVVPIVYQNGAYVAHVPVRSLTAQASVSFDPNGNYGFGWVSYSADLLDTEGHSTLDTANWPAWEPRFFSGTGCVSEALAIAPKLSGFDMIEKAQLCITDNGTDVVVKEYDAPTGVYLTNNVNLAANFDSTHFANAASVPIKIKVWTSTGLQYTDTITGPIKNRIYDLANHTYPAMWLYALLSMNDVNSDATKINYFVNPSNSDLKPEICDLIPVYTAFFITTHGEVAIGDTDENGDGGHTDANGVELHFIRISAAPDDPHTINNAIAAKVANPNLPPYNYVQIDACQLGKDSSYADAFGVTSGVDRAFLGWPDTILIDFDVVDWNSVLWNGLALGYSLLESAQSADEQLRHTRDHGVPSFDGRVP